jgi:hypothetical protein
MKVGDEDLTAAERTAWAALRRDLAPPDALERKVVQTLAARDLLRRRHVEAPRRWLRPLALLAAAAAFFALGVAIGTRTTRLPSPSHALPHYVLFLEGPGEPAPDLEMQRVREYKLWARHVARGGHLVGGEKLRPEALRLPVGVSGSFGGEAIRGFFVIAARDDGEALEIARGCPHLRYGGRIIVRRIAPV